MALSHLTRCVLKEFLGDIFSEYLLISEFFSKNWKTVLYKVHSKIHPSSRNFTEIF